MTNPDNSVGTNGAFGGRTSVNAFNDGIAAYTSGILSGWACNPSSGLTVVLGGDGNTRDVAIAEDNSGNKTTVNNISGSPIAVTVGNAPNNNSRIDSIVAYVDNPPTGSSTATDNYGACGLIVVPGSVASSPVAPTESAIRSAITADGASGTTAYFVVLANVIIPSGTTDLTSNNIQEGSQSNNVTESYSLSEMNTGAKWVDGKDIYKKTVYWASLPNTTEVQSGSLGVTNINAIKIEGSATAGTGVIFVNMYRPVAPESTWSVRVDNATGLLYVGAGTNYTSYSGYATIYYTKNS